MYALDHALLSILSFFTPVITIDYKHIFDVSYDTKIISTISLAYAFGVKTQAFAISNVVLFFVVFHPYFLTALS